MERARLERQETPCSLKLPATYTVVVRTHDRADRPALD
jgi:hypothetical protein